MAMNDLKTAYQICEKIAKNHYENFPVASFLLPKPLRRPIAAIYAFARTADDIADEGELSNSGRLQQLELLNMGLESLHQAGTNNIFNDVPFRTIQNLPYIFAALQDSIQKYKLPIQLLFDLLQAFKQDVVKSSYQNYEEVLEYCQYSANPIGRLLLYLTKNDTEENLLASDAICTALQLINFLQDINPDLVQRNRCYLPQDEMKQSLITLESLKNKHNTEELQKLIQRQLIRISDLLIQGRPLALRLKGRFGFEIRLILACAHLMVRKLQSRSNVFARPTLRFFHWPGLIIEAL